MNAQLIDDKITPANDSKADLLAEAITLIELFLYGGKADIENDAMLFLRKNRRPIRKPRLVDA